MLRNPDFSGDKSSDVLIKPQYAAKIRPFLYLMMRGDPLIRMNRFFVPKEDCKGSVIRLTDQDDVHHLTRVLRLRSGEKILVSDGEGGAFVTVLEGYDKHSAQLKVVESLPRKQREDQRWRLSLAVAVPKNARFEDVVDKNLAHRKG